MRRGHSTDGKGKPSPDNRLDRTAGPAGHASDQGPHLQRRYPQDGKIVGIFEPSAEVIREGKAAKPTEFGKLVKLREAENEIVVDYEVCAATA
jgi:hypothetical protein